MAPKSVAPKSVAPKSVVLMAAVLALLAGRAYAQSALETRSEGGIVFASGGIGEDSLEAMRAAERKFNFHVLFAARGSGQYLADVKVKLSDAAGRTVLDTMADGPLFYAKLPPGRYKLELDTLGRTQTQSVNLRPKGSVSDVFYW